MDILYTLIIYPVTQIIELVFVFAQKMFRETGVSIMCVSGVISVLCLPLYLKAEVWRTKEREIQRRLKAKAERIKAVFKGDEQYMTLSAYYRQNHYHPVYATRTAFGLFLQVPFFIAAYSYLSHSPLLNGARFLFISDLARPDGLIKTITGGGGALNILPVGMTAVNMLSASLYTKGFSFKEKAPLYGMALLFLAALYNSPAGLVLYWTTNNIFSLLKNIYTAISFKRKKFILLGGISFFALLFSYYTLFIHHGNTKTRILIAILSLLTGVFPWIIPAIIKLIKKFK
ncbi:MAG: YidC/Oxa1 family membrane protein insertase, partial [Spirochaetaceae bacterium]|nr:YidC/Oxa1 family membrane protein insertase [Spirochaetaceae bacterium]